MATPKVWLLSQNRFTGTYKVPTNLNASLNKAVDGATYEVLYKSLNKIFTWVKADGQWVQAGSGGIGGDIYTDYGEVITGYPTDGYIEFTRTDLTTYDVDLKEMAGLGMAIDGEGKYTLDIDPNTLVTPELNTSWTILDDGGSPYTPPSGPTDYLAAVTRGCTVQYNSSFYYNLSEGIVGPDTIEGDYGTVDPGDGNNSPTIGATVSVNTTKTVTFRRTRSGLVVVNGNIVITVEDEVTSASMLVRFYENIHIGGVDHINAIASELNPLVSPTLYAASAASIRRTDIDVGNDFLYVCFPTLLGPITDVIINDAQSIGVGVFVDEGTLSLVNTGDINVTNNIYRSTVRDAYPASSGIYSLTFLF